MLYTLSSKVDLWGQIQTHRAIFASGWENSFKEVLSVTSKISSSTRGFLSSSPAWLFHAESVCFNLQPCSPLTIPLSPLHNHGSLQLMKDFFVVHSEDDTKSRFIKAAICFLGTELAHRSRIWIGCKLQVAIIRILHSVLLPYNETVIC